MDTRYSVLFTVTLLATLSLGGGCLRLPMQGTGIQYALPPEDDSAPLSSIPPDPFLVVLPVISCREDDPFRSVLEPQDESPPSASAFTPPALPESAQKPEPESASPEAFPDEEALGLALDAEEERKPLTWEEQETILAKDLWAPNIELRRQEENGGRNPAGQRDQAQLKKMNNLLRLNMSDRDRQKQQSTLYDYSTGLISTWRWFHSDIKRMEKSPRQPADEFLISKKYLGKKHRILRANAAILLGRSGDSRVKQYLMRVVENEELSIYLRCAAVETLGAMETVEADDLLSLLDSAKERDVERAHPRQEGTVTQTVVLPKIWEEILIALSQRIAPWEHPCFLEPFSARNYDIRLATAKLWRRQTPPESVSARNASKARLPDRLMEYAVRETAPEIRAELLLLMGKWKEPKLLELAKTDLHQITTIRNAAMDALAEMGYREAVPLVKEKLTDAAPLNRAKAVETLRKLGCYEDVFRMADDQAWQVRVEVAKAFAERRTPETHQKARLYLTTGNERVQKEALEAVAAWPIEESGPLVLEALKSPVQATRIRAAALLSEHFEPARYYNAGSMPDKQVEEHRDLSRRFLEFLQSEARDTRVFEAHDSAAPVAAASTAEVDYRKLPEVRRLLDDWNQAGRSYRLRRPIEDRLVALGDQLVPLLNHLYAEESRSVPASLDGVFALVDPWFERIVQLETDNDARRRQAASELARWSRNQRAGVLVADRIREFCREESDPLVLRPLLETLKNVDEKSACSLSRELLEHPSPDLRRQACFQLGESGTEKDLPALAGVLRDENRGVVRASLEALLAILPEIPEAAVDRHRDAIRKGLERLLLDTDPSLQTDLAAVQFLLGLRAGEDSLRRLARSGEAKVRHYAVKRIGDLQDPVFLPLLIERLDDSNGSVSSEALAALPRVIGEDIAGDLADSFRPGDARLTRVRADRWKKWFERYSYETSQNPLR